MNEALQALEVKVENGGTTPQGKFFAKDWNTLVEAVKALDLKELDEASLLKFLKDNGYITSDEVPEVDLSAVVTLATEQRITGTKDFVGGIKVNGQPLIYNAVLGVWELTGDLLVTGNVAWFASIKGFKPSTIMDAVQVDGETIVKNELGQLKVIGGGSGGSGGGLTISDLSNYLATNKYTKQSDVETLISTALTPYALTSAIPTNNNQLTNGAGYITSSALTGYATEQWVGDNYLSKSGGTISFGNSNSLLTVKSTGGTWSGIKYESATEGGYIGVHRGEPVYIPQDMSMIKKIVLSDNIKSTLGISDWALAATKPSYTAAEVGALSTSGGTVSSDDYQPLIVNSNFSSGIEDVRIAISHNWNVKGLFNWESNGVGLRMYNTACGSAIGIKDDGTPYYDSYTLIHSGNIGQYAYMSKRDTIPSGEDLANLQAGSYWVYENLGAASAAKLSYSSLVVLGNSYYSPQMNISHNAQQAYIRGVYNTGSGNSVSDWHELAFVDSNVASATKLQTPRTIWGHIFDGSGNVDGDLYMGGATMLHTDGSDTWLNYGGANDGKNLRLCGRELIFQYGRGDAFTRAMTITNGGNVAVGGTTADAKLHVHGNGLLYNTLSDTAWVSDTGQLIIGSSGTNYHLGFGVASNGLAAIQGGNRGVGAISLLLNPNGGNVVIGGTTANAKLHVHGNAQIDGDVLVNGNFSWITQSQRSLKHITSEQGLSLAQLERIKPIKFYWKDGRDSILHVGGVADVFAEVLPEVVSRWKDTLCLNYVDAGFYVGASLIAPVLDHERRITEGERERKALKMENATLKRELAIMKQMLNQLAA